MRWSGYMTDNAVGTSSDLHEDNISPASRGEFIDQAICASRPV